MNGSLKQILLEKPLTLIASLPANSYEIAKAAWENGAHAVKVHINVEHRASKTAFKSIDEEKDVLLGILRDCPVPVGIVAGGDICSVEKDFSKTEDMRFSFISLYLHHATPAVLKHGRIEKMMAADYSYTIDEIRKFKSIGVDILEASIIPPEGYGQRLNMRDIVKYADIVENADMPVVLPTQRKVAVEDLEVIRNAGIKGVMVGAIVMGRSVEDISRIMAEFRGEIDRING